MLFEDKDGSKTGHGRRGFLQEGAWDAIHVIEVSMFPLNKDHPLDSACSFTLPISFPNSGEARR